MLKATIGKAALALAIVLCMFVQPTAALAQAVPAGENPREWQLCQLGNRQLGVDLGPHGTPGAGDNIVTTLRRGMLVAKAEIDTYDIHCTGLTGYQQSRATRLQTYRNFESTCRQLVSDPSVCVPLVNFVPARVGYAGEIMSPARSGPNVAAVATPGIAAAAAAAAPASAPPGVAAPAAAPALPPLSSGDAAVLNEAARRQRLWQNLSRDVANDQTTGLTADQRALSSTWIARRSTMYNSEAGLPASLRDSPQYRAWRAQPGNQPLAPATSQAQCSQLSNPADADLCNNGAFFGTPEQRARAENVDRFPSPFPYTGRRRTVGADHVNRCLTVETGGLFGGVVNSCDFSVMYTYCIENPPADSWGSNLRCVNGRNTNALDIVPARSRQAGHTRGGNVVLFACAWSSGALLGPDGIRGQTVYTEGVGTAGVIRGQCTESVAAN